MRPQATTHQDNFMTMVIRLMLIMVLYGRTFWQMYRGSYKGSYSPMVYYVSCIFFVGLILFSFFHQRKKIQQMKPGDAVLDPLADEAVENQSENEED